MGELRRRVGFWAAVRKTTIGDLLTVEIGGGALIGAAASWWLVGHTSAQARVGLAGDYLTMTPALLGIVFAALAMVVALMSDQYLRLLRESGQGDGVVAFLRPFMLVIGLQVGALLSAVGFRAFAQELPAPVASWAFGVVTVLFVVSTLEIAALARNVIMHGVGRSELQRVSSIDGEREKRRTG